MVKGSKTMLLAVICFLPVCVMAQKKDSLQLVCPLNEATEPPAEKQPYSLGVEQPKIVLMSASDTTVKACISGTVTTILKDDDGKWEVMFNNKDYYFYYSGLGKIKVSKGQKLQQGDAIGILKPGDKMELMIYDFETPLDPKKLLNCGKKSE
ncbi:MAG: peptidoglycan DD-metalloendopeptidase family protein [Chitinophagaceae bacterium]|nr:peptidoglycan DD-metalloendopeptidase family protein [Chitinophagaceae bacterium]